MKLVRYSLVSELKLIINRYINILTEFHLKELAMNYI